MTKGRQSEGMPAPDISPDQVARFVLGDEMAFGYVIVEIEALLRSIVGRYVRNGDDAAGLMQRIRITLWRKRGSYHGKGTFEGWASHVARNCCIDWTRREKVRRQRIERYGREERAVQQLQDRDGIPKEQQSREREEAAEEATEELERGRASLSERQWQSLYLVDVDAHSLKDVASMWGISLGTLKATRHRARQKLNQRLKRDPADPS